MKSFQPLIISLLAHIVLYLLALVTPTPNWLPERNQPIEIVYQNETKPRVFVTDPDKEELEKAVQELKDKAERLSRVTRRVRQETAARKTGKTQNGAPGSTASSLRESARRDLRSRQEPRDPSGAHPPALGGSIAREARLSDSTIAEYIPEVREGGFTALNADQFVHYTFYARINEQIRNRWVENIRNFLNHTPPAEINRLAQKTQISQVEILLDSDGRFVKALFHQQSEHKEIDLSAELAFQDAAPLHNPPLEMVEADGYIHLRYGFYVQFRPRYMASGSQGP